VGKTTRYGLKLSLEISGNIMKINKLRMGLRNSERISTNGKVGARCPVAADVSRRIPDDLASRLLARPVLRARRDRRLTSAATGGLALARAQSHFDFVPFCARVFIFSFHPSRIGAAISSFLFRRDCKARPHFGNDLTTNPKTRKHSSVFLYAFFA
jgi:hypothetical protein